MGMGKFQGFNTPTTCAVLGKDTLSVFTMHVSRCATLLQHLHRKHSSL